MTKKKTFTSLISFMLCLSMFMMFACPVLADSPKEPIQISFSELPKGYQEVVDSNATIYKNPDGTFDIFQDNAVLDDDIHVYYDQYIRDAPIGGSYSNLEKGWISKITCVVYQTYLPRDKVDEWICDQNPGMRDYIVGLAAELGLAKASTIATKVLAKYGVNISVGAIVTIVQGAIFTLKWLNYQQVLKASNKGKNGIMIEYLTTIGAGNARVYTDWKIPKVERYPYGGNATWHNGDYYVMP